MGYVFLEKIRSAPITKRPCESVNQKCQTEHKARECISSSRYSSGGAGGFQHLGFSLKDMSSLLCVRPIIQISKYEVSK